MSHKSVLLQEVISGLDIKDGNTFVDMTLGNGGHTKILAMSGPKKLNIIGIDADKIAIKVASKNLESLSKDHKISIHQSYFDELPKILEKNNIQNIDKALFDLGIRSDQIDEAERGFSFIKEGPLNMSFDADAEINAETIVNEFEEDLLEKIISAFGEEKFSKKIANSIVSYRQLKRITSTTELAEIIYQSVPGFYRRSKIHPATKTFQALRIAVNKELQRFETALNYVFSKLNSNGRIAVISFHSLEDRIAKNFFREQVKNGNAILINKKPIIPKRSEILENPRARSAKLRIIQKN